MDSHSENRHPDELDGVIDRCGMMDKTGLTREQIHKYVHKATLCLNIASCLADVCETLVMDAEGILRHFGATFVREDKKNFRLFAKAMQDTQKCARRCCAGLYSHKDADAFAEDSDWWYNIVRLIADRVGDDELKTKQLINWIDAMPSLLQMFNVKKRDFKRIIV